VAFPKRHLRKYQTRTILTLIFPLLRTVAAERVQ
jgi:hypothetical protein